MKEIKFIFSKALIFDEVSLNSEYAGVKTLYDDNLYERVATNDSDSELLSKFWREACGEITDKIQCFITSVIATEESFTLDLQLSGAYDDALTKSVETDLQGFMVAAICGRWFRFTFPEKAEEWIQQSYKLLNRVFAKLCSRKKPTRQP